jgi:hypothetical protein
MKTGHIGADKPMIHYTPEMKDNMIMIVDNQKPLAITDHRTIRTYEIQNIRMNEPFIYDESRQFRGKNKSKRRYPKPR